MTELTGLGPDPESGNSLAAEERRSPARHREDIAKTLRAWRDSGTGRASAHA